jgi:hypothetical protein
MEMPAADHTSEEPQPGSCDHLIGIGVGLRAGDHLIV